MLNASARRPSAAGLVGKDIPVMSDEEAVWLGSPYFVPVHDLRKRAARCQPQCRHADQTSVARLRFAVSDAVRLMKQANHWCLARDPSACDAARA